MIGALPAVEADASAVTPSGAVPDTGVTVRRAVGPVTGDEAGLSRMVQASPALAVALLVAVSPP